MMLLCACATVLTAYGLVAALVPVVVMAVRLWRETLPFSRAKEMKLGPSRRPSSSLAPTCRPQSSSHSGDCRSSPDLGDHLRLLTRKREPERRARRIAHRASYRRGLGRRSLVLLVLDQAERVSEREELDRVAAAAKRPRALGMPGGRA
jgi:hypothetical protein